MEWINRMRKDKKGFTLVEIIVVLVILAILAAFMIPSMIGFVGEAKKKAAIAEQREVYVAAQAIVTERFAKNATTACTDLGLSFAADAADDAVAIATNLGSVAVVSADANAETAAGQMKKYIGSDLNPITTASSASNKGSNWIVTVNKSGKITKVEYTRDGITLDPLVPYKDF